MSATASCVITDRLTSSPRPKAAPHIGILGLAEKTPKFCSNYVEDSDQHALHISETFHPVSNNRPMVFYLAEAAGAAFETRMVEPPKDAIDGPGIKWVLFEDNQ